MKTPVLLVTVTLAVAILLASLLIVTGSRGEDTRWPLADPAAQIHTPGR